MQENWTDLVGWFSPGARLECFEGCTRDPRLRPTWIQIRSLVTLSYLPSHQRYLSAKWIVSRDTIRSLVGEENSILCPISLSLSKTTKKIRGNYLISGPATNEITAQSWGVEFQLQLWSQAETRWSVRSINPSISDTLSQISYWSATKNIERARAFSRSDVTCDAPLSKVEFVSKVRRACPDNWTGWKELAGWTEAKE